MRMEKMKWIFVIGLLVAGGPVCSADALTISILDIGQNGTTADGTVFLGDPDPTSPSTGTGVFEPFVRVQQSNRHRPLQNGFNTDAGGGDANFNTHGGSDWTRSVLFGELGTVSYNGQSYFLLQLDANQLGNATSDINRITITDMQIYIASDPALANPEAVGTGPYGNGYTGTAFNSPYNGVPGGTSSLLGYAPIWTLDSAENGDVDIILQASICASNGQCGSGHGDLSVYIPSAYLSGRATDQFVFYTEYSGANDGFEEWRFSSGPSQQVPEPGSLLLLGAGFISFVIWRRSSWPVISVSHESND